MKIRIVIFSCKWGAQLAIQVCHPITRVYWDPNLLSWETEGKCVQEQTTHHIPQLLHACFRFISVPSEGATPQTDTWVLCLCFFSCLCLLWHVLYKTFFHKQQMDCCRSHLLACTVKVLNARSRGGGKLTAVWRPGQRRGGCAFCGSPRFLKSGTLWLVRKLRSEIDNFPCLYIWQFTTFPTMAAFLP